MALNPAHTAVQEIAIVTYSQPRSGGSISEVTQGQALQMVVSQRQVAESSMDHPYLVYFALDPQGGSNNHTGWTGGGALPADPVWLVPTATGRPYVAGDDGTVYTVDQLPQAAP